MPVLIRFSMPPIAFWQQSGRTCSLNTRILSLDFDYLLIEAENLIYNGPVFSECSALSIKEKQKIGKTGYTAEF